MTSSPPGPFVRTAGHSSNRRWPDLRSISTWEQKETHLAVQSRSASSFSLAEKSPRVAISTAVHPLPWITNKKPAPVNVEWKITQWNLAELMIFQIRRPNLDPNWWLLSALHLGMNPSFLPKLVGRFFLYWQLVFCNFIESP